MSEGINEQMDFHNKGNNNNDNKGNNKGNNNKGNNRIWRARHRVPIIKTRACARRRGDAHATCISQSRYGKCTHAAALSAHGCVNCFLSMGGSRAPLCALAIVHVHKQ